MCCSISAVLTPRTSARSDAATGSEATIRIASIAPRSVFSLIGIFSFRLNRGHVQGRGRG